MALPTGLKTSLLDVGLGAIAVAITHIGLGNSSGVELGGGSPAYARKAASWNAASGGTITLKNDIVFDIPASTDVECVLLFGQASGGVDLGGKAVPKESFNKQGMCTVRAGSSFSITNQ